MNSALFAGFGCLLVVFCVSIGTQGAGISIDDLTNSDEWKNLNKSAKLMLLDNLKSMSAPFHQNDPLNDQMFDNLKFNVQQEGDVDGLKSKQNEQAAGDDRLEFGSSGFDQIRKDQLALLDALESIHDNQAGGREINMQDSQQLANDQLAQFDERQKKETELYKIMEEVSKPFNFNPVVPVVPKGVCTTLEDGGIVGFRCKAIFGIIENSCCGSEMFQKCCISERRVYKLTAAVISLAIFGLVYAYVWCIKQKHRLNSVAMERISSNNTSATPERERHVPFDGYKRLESV